jgi:plastocyanin
MINAGQTVTWTNTDGPHTVTSNPGTIGCNPVSTEAFSSPVLNNGQAFSHMFMTPGTYTYHCEIHGCTMTGTITVM